MREALFAARAALEADEADPKPHPLCALEHFARAIRELARLGHSLPIALACRPSCAPHKKLRAEYRAEYAAWREAYMNSTEGDPRFNETLSREVVRRNSSQRP